MFSQKHTIRNSNRQFCDLDIYPEVKVLLLFKGGFKQEPKNYNDNEILFLPSSSIQIKSSTI